MHIYLILPLTWKYTDRVTFVLDLVKYIRQIDAYTLFIWYDSRGFNQKNTHQPNISTI